MNINVFREKIKGRKFRSTDEGIIYRFIGDSTLQVNNSIVNSVHYSIEKVDGLWLLNHNSLFGTESLIIEILGFESPISFSLTKRFSKEFMGTWRELEN